ncbi:MAG: hypothetical protein KF895_15305 [Parvibaculum sp.]|uniref:phage tail protein n=1 Tax=Chelatococcus sp. TaxID=1953771 RepID=UPI001EC11AE0|nr:phage tail protein [Chelatococcus sp.]MBX3506846.1 hypothetical protein [Parvibaculum sp.]MBX3545593.1 hypothetical protein [Chelatococcus sp.]
MAEPVALLPQNAKSWELAHEITDLARWDSIDPQWIVRQSDPMTCDPAVLPVIAAERHVDLWYDDWSLEKKRFVVANWYAYERLKGREEGFRRFYRLVGAELLRVVAPPQYTVLRGGLSEEQRQAWLAQFQQLRMYPLVPAAINTRTLVLRYSGTRSRFVLGKRSIGAREIRGLIREARLFDPDTGQETVLTRREVQREVTNVGSVYDFEDVVIPVRFQAAFIGGSLRAGPLRRSGLAAERTVRIRVERPNMVAVPSTIWTSTVPTGRLVSINPELVRAPIKVDGAVIGKCATGYHASMVLRPNRAFLAVYERFYLFDRKRDRGVSAGYPGSAIGRTRLGMMPYTAHMKVRFRLPSKASDLRVGAGLGRTLRADRPDVLEPLLQAARAAKAGRDRIFINTTTRRKQRFGDGISFSDRTKFGAQTDA